MTERAAVTLVLGIDGREVKLVAVATGAPVSGAVGCDATFVI